MPMVFVPAGQFLMGSNQGDDGSDGDEFEQHTVTLGAFWIDIFEVTNAQYALCVADGACQPPSETKSYTRNAYYNDPQYAGYPVIYVDWNDANAYCTWTGRRLPTEAEWEKAARGENGQTYPWGNGEPTCDLANFWGKDGGNSACVGDTTVAGSYPAGASPYGALDMAGNVWEWVSSLYKPYPYQADDGREDLGASGARALRGGGWNNNWNRVRAADRDLNDPTGTYNIVGFRCARSP
jgi:serine/threonine-protein kinase